jgi:hypothetical protein
VLAEANLHASTRAKGTVLVVLETAAGRQEAILHADGAAELLTLLQQAAR